MSYYLGRVTNLNVVSTVPVIKTMQIAKPIKRGLIAAIPQPLTAKRSVSKQLIVIAAMTARLGVLAQNGFLVRVIKIVSMALKIR